MSRGCEIEISSKKKGKAAVLKLNSRANKSTKMLLRVKTRRLTVLSQDTAFISKHRQNPHRSGSHQLEPIL